MGASKVKRGAGIKRISDHKQKGNTSLQTQEDELRNRASREGYEVEKVFEDVAKSAYHKNVTQRQAMKNLIDYVLDDKNDIEAVFFYDESRLSRQFYDFVLYVYKVIKEEKPYVKFFSALEDGEWNPFDIKAVLNFATAAQQSIEKSSRAIDGQKTSLKKKERPGSQAPYGYRLVYPESKEEGRRAKAMYVVDESQAAIIRFIFYHTSWGHSQERIAKLLNDAGVRSPEISDWQGGTIDYILNNDSYLGHLPWNVRTHQNTSRQKQRGEYDLLPNHHEPIINVSLWFLAHQAIALHKQSGRNNKSQFYLRNLIFCKSCNIELTPKNNSPAKTVAKKRYLIYRCSSCKCKIDLESLHNEVLTTLTGNWKLQLMKMADGIKALLTVRKKEIIKYQETLNGNLKKVIFEEEYLFQNHNKVTENTDWDFILSLSKNKLKKDQAKVHHFIEVLKALENDANSSTIFSLLSRFDLKGLSNTELRTLLLSVYRKISIDFDSGHLLYVDFKFAPFTEIEQYYDDIIKNT